MVSDYLHKKLHLSFTGIGDKRLEPMNPTSHFTKRLKRLLYEFRNVIFLDAMDFLKDWKKGPMWRRKKIFGII